MDNSDEDSQSEENLAESNSSILPSSSATPCSNENETFSTPNHRKRHRCLTSIYKNKRSCSAERSEIIDQYLTKMIATIQLPLSFVSCPGFVNFMSVIEPNYKICKEITLKKRLNNLYTEVKNKIREELRVASIVACTSDCWTSLAQNSYLTMYI